MVVSSSMYKTVSDSIVKHTHNKRERESGGEGVCDRLRRRGERDFSAGVLGSFFYSDTSETGPDRK